MLHFKAVEPGTLSLLNDLMGLPYLRPFSLVGGTALALRYGHRASVDLDLFFHERFDHEALERSLIDTFRTDYYSESGHKQFGIFAYIRQVKVDIVYFPHHLIADIDVQYNIRLYNDADICAMKIQAILGRAKKKDFWDLYELLKNYSLQQMIDWHKLKYPNQMLAISIPNAISYFDEADDTETPVSLQGQTWENVKKGIQQAVRDYLK